MPPRVSAYPMVSVHEALETILDHAQPLGHETVELTHARGRILAQDILADADLPGMPRSSVDGFALMAGDEEAGARVAWHAHAVDDEAALERAMRNGLATADVLLTSGGVSMGTRDLIKPLLEKLATIHFGRVSFKPGKPLTFATTDGKLAFGLPGFPVSSLVTLEVFVRPALLKLGGAANVMRPRVEVVLGHEIRPDPVRPEYQRATVTWEDHHFVARTTGLQSSSRLMSIVGANALLELSPGDNPLPKGTMVQALLLAN